MEFDELSGRVIGCAIEVHRNLGPGLLESTYRQIKTVDTLVPIHQAQILNYKRLAKIPIGLLMNFNLIKLQNGIKRFVL